MDGCRAEIKNTDPDSRGRYHGVHTTDMASKEWAAVILLCSTLFTVRTCVGLTYDHVYQAHVLGQGQ